MLEEDSTMRNITLSAVHYLDANWMELFDDMNAFSSLVILGGETALSKAWPSLEKGLNLAKVTKHIYGKEVTQANVDRIKQLADVQRADMILAVGGGKAIDTAKWVGDALNIPVCTLPTVASTCAASSAVAVEYHEDHSFCQVRTLKRSPLKVYLPLWILVEAPSHFLWAGIGDTLAKPIEIEFNIRHKPLSISEQLSKTISQLCISQCVLYGSQAMEDAKKQVISDAFIETAFTVIVTTGYASSLIDYRYGGSLAHAINNALTHYHEIEAHHYHGEVVSYGVLVMLLLDQQYPLFETVLPLYQALHLPSSLDNLGLPNTVEFMHELCTYIIGAPDLNEAAYPIQCEMIVDSMQRLEAMNIQNH